MYDTAEAAARRPVWILFGFAAAVFLGACSSESPELADFTTTTSEPATSAPSSSTTALEGTSPSIEEAALDDALDRWLGAVAAVRASEPLDTAPLDALAATSIVEATLAPIQFERDNLAWRQLWADHELQSTEVTIDGSTATWAGCVAVRLLSEGDETAPGERINVERVTARFVADGDALVLDAYDVVDDVCLPADHGLDLATIEADVTDAITAPPSYLDPPVLDEALIARHRTDEMVTNGLSLAQFLIDEGLVFRASVEVDDVAVVAKAFDLVIVQSCQVLGEDYGVYAQATGDPAELEGIELPGTQITSTGYYREEGGTWKLVNAFTEGDSGCASL